MGSNWMMVMLVVSLFGPVPAARAAATVDTGNAWMQGNACHPLLMAAECARQQITFATLPMGAERDRYMAEQRELIAEREAACGGNRPTEIVFLKPQAKPRQAY